MEAKPLIINNRHALVEVIYPFPVFKGNADVGCRFSVFLRVANIYFAGDGTY